MCLWDSIIYIHNNCFEHDTKQRYLKDVDYLRHLIRQLYTRISLYMPLQSSVAFAGSTHDVYVLFDDVSYDDRSAHWRVNNKIKRKFTLF